MEERGRDRPSLEHPVNAVRSGLFRAVGLSVAYGVVSYGALMLGRDVGVAAVVWPSNALAMGFILVLLRPNAVAAICGVAIANVVAHLMVGDAIVPSLVAGVANGLSIGLTATIFSSRRAMQDENSYVDVVSTLIAASLLGPIPGAVVGGLAMGALLSPNTPPAYYIGSWWLVEAVAYLLLLPPFLFWRSRSARRAQAEMRRTAPITLSPLRALELLAAISALALSAAIVPLTGMIWLIELSGAVLLWIALRFGMFYTATTAALFAGGVVVCGLFDLWPGSPALGPQANMLALQAMLSLTTLPALVVAAIATQREKARRALAASERRLSHALEGANDGLWDWDFAVDGGFFSQRAAKMFGYDNVESFEKLAGWDTLIHEDDRGQVRATFDAHMRGETEFYDHEFRCRCNDGSWIWVHDRGKIVERTDDGSPVRAVGTYTDISDRKRLEAALEELATMDALTGLFNRGVFNRELERFAARLDRQGGRLAVLLIDIDHFKAVNDTYGHGAGDAVLAQVGQRMQALVRAGDVAARLGGDEFALISIGKTTGEFEALAERLTIELSEPVVHNGQVLNASVSIGVAVATSGDHAGDDLVSRADRALYAAKRDGRGVWRRSDPVGPPRGKGSTREVA